MTGLFLLTDADGDAVSITSTSGAVGLSIVGVSGNSVNFTPLSNFTGAASFNYPVSDGFGGTASGTVTVNVTDNDAPVVTVPANIVAEETGPTGRAVTFTLTPATDIVDGAVTPTASPASGSLFPVGVTTVTVSATDAHSNTGSATFTVTVLDPTLSVHAASDEAQFTTGETTVYPLANDFVPLGASIVISSVSDSAITIDGRALRAPAGTVCSVTRLANRWASSRQRGPRPVPTARR